MSAAPQPKPDPSIRRILPVTLAGQVYGIPCALVWMFSHARLLERLPTLLPPLQGVLHSSGRLIPVINLRRKYHLPGSSPRSAPIIVVPLHLPDEPQFPVGLIFDRIHPVIEVRVPVLGDGEPAVPDRPLPCLAAAFNLDLPLLDCDQAASLKLHRSNLILAA